MGYYINPKNGTTKEAWLAEHGMSISEPAAKAHTAGARVVVCLIDNGWMTAAGIAYDDRERDAFTMLDSRPKSWYLVNREQLVAEGFLKA